MTVNRQPSTVYFTNVIRLVIVIPPASSLYRYTPEVRVEASKVTEVFKEFGSASEGAGRAQQKFATDLAFLQSALRTGKVDSEQFVAEFKNIPDAAAETAEKFREGARLTEENRTQEEKRAAELARLNDLLELGAINQETFNRASVEASGAGDAAREAAKAQADADKVRADAATRAAAIVEAMPCAAQLRFLGSGTEADMYAMRVVRAFRRREKILKFEGGYHGMSDHALMSLAPKRPSNFPRPIPDSAAPPTPMPKPIVDATSACVSTMRTRTPLVAPIAFSAAW